MANKIRVGVIDIYPLFRDGLVQAIGRSKQMTVVGEGASAAEAEQLSALCDVLVMEPAVPNSLGAAKTILAYASEVKLVFLAAIQDDVHTRRALDLGVHGYLLKGITGSDLVDALVAVHGGAREITSDLAWRLLTQSKNVVPAKRERVHPLTVREQQVLDQTSKGLTNAQMAELLGLSVSSIKRYKTKVFRRMGVRNRLQAMASAGLLPHKAKLS